MACITSPYYSLLVNGEVQGFFPGKCGLRQGDPLSPYIFVLCMKVLSRLLRTLPKVKNFSYHPKCVQLNLTHLIFADDLLIFTRGDLPSVKAVSDCLDQFSMLSGLVANNPSKTDLYYGGVAADVKDLILAATGFSEGKFPFRWVQTYVLKGQSLWLARQTISNSWYWNNVVKMKDLLLNIAGSSSLAMQLLERCTYHARFDTNAAYDLVRSRREPVPWHSFVHGKGCHPKYSFIGLMVMTDSLPTVAKLITRGLFLVNRCVLYECSMEDLHHVFFNCSCSRQVWAAVAQWVHLPLFFSLDAIVQAFLSEFRNGKQKACLMASFHFIWKERNSRIFKGTKSSSDSLCIVIKRAVLDSIVGPEQAAFVADRDIFDNTMLAHELVSKYGRAYLTPRCLLKTRSWPVLPLLITLSLVNGEVQGFFPGLVANNPSKTDLYYGGVAADVKDLTLAATGFSEGKFPFRFDTNAAYDPVRSRRELVPWHSFVHGKGHPKYSFIGLMVMTDSLPTVAKLITRGLFLVNRCVLYECSMEDLHHVFFNCSCSRQVWAAVAQWVHLPLFFSLDAIVQAFLSEFRNSKQKACLMASFHFIWKERNSRIFKGTKSSSDSLCIVIKRAVSLRLYGSSA
ncbi:uncharacterized protein LOC141617784 [Silene latifolia]|uniref:uncharacterized protein LOC141617784 n=1 Tax=Silene latifolia TaxID=37657 RepID=UPI003D779AC2